MAMNKFGTHAHARTHTWVHKLTMTERGTSRACCGSRSTVLTAAPKPNPQLAFDHRCSTQCSQPKAQRIPVSYWVQAIAWKLRHQVSLDSHLLVRVRRVGRCVRRNDVSRTAGWWEGRQCTHKGCNHRIDPDGVGNRVPCPCCNRMGLQSAQWCRRRRSASAADAVHEHGVQIAQ